MVCGCLENFQGFDDKRTGKLQAVPLNVKSTRSAWCQLQIRGASCQPLDSSGPGVCQAGIDALIASNETGGHEMPATQKSLQSLTGALELP